MDVLAAKLRERAKQLGISNAEAARRCKLSERRYAHYVQGIREPDLQTLVNIASALETTPDQLLGVQDIPVLGEQGRLMDRLTSAARVLSKNDLSLVVTQVEALASRR